jgi:pyrimidine-nucleoside phosphorylase
VPELRRALREIGLFVVAQTADLAPADKQLYALRDVTATVDSIPLIAASVMSKKIAAGATCMVLDVKYGSGAFMRTQDEARELARTMVSIGIRSGRKVTAVISSMEQPLGYAIGNALEVFEALEALQEGNPPDLVALCLEIGAQLALLAGRAPDHASALRLLRRALQSGAAWGKFRQMVDQQGGDIGVVDDPYRLPRAPYVLDIAAEQTGYVARVDARTLGITLNMLGGGRMVKNDTIDPAVGIVVRARVGDYVQAGDPLLYVHARDEGMAAQVRAQLLTAYTFAAAPVEPPPLISEVITEADMEV